MKKFIWVILGIFSIQTVNSQSYIGYGMDNYSGVHGILLNPSQVVNSKMKADINLFSASGLAGNDYFNLDFNTILNGEGGFDFNSGIKTFPTNQNNFLLNFDILGPSIMFNLSPKHSIALITRARGILNLYNVNGELFEALEEGFDESKSIQANMENLNGVFHGWAEFGISYGRLLINTTENSLKGGLSIKYLKGAGGMYFNSNTLNGDYDNGSGTLTTSGDLQYGSSQDFEAGDFNFSNTASGLGFDVGISYEYKGSKFRDSLDLSNNYKLKIGVSVVDIGSISYKNSKVTTYDMNRTVNTNDFEDEDFQTVLINNYDGVEEVTTSTMVLPTSANILLDYQIRKRLYIAVHSSLSLIPKDKKQANKILNTVTVLPRLETKWLGLGIPVSIREYDNVMVGTNFRLGPFFAGSGSVLSNLFTDSTTSVDVYAGVKVSLYKKS